MAVALALSANVSVLADVTETVEKYRASFEKRMNLELDEFGKAARALRLNYIQALKGLKLELGRAENLKGAAQVVAELEAVEDGEETGELPADADYRLKRLREQRERGLSDIRTARNKKLGVTLNLYFKALDEEKRRRTRAGKIKDALLVEEEQKRVKELPEVKVVLAPREGEKRELTGRVEIGDLALATRGATAKAPERHSYLIDGRYDNVALYSRGKFPCSFIVVLDNLYVLEKIRVNLYDADRRRYRYELEVSADNITWEKLVRDEGKGVRGWQDIKFEPRDVKYIRVRGLHNTANEYVHLLEIEAYCPKKR